MCYNIGTDYILRGDIMYEMMKLKYRKQLNDQTLTENLRILDDVLTKLQEILIHENPYDCQILISTLEPLIRIDLHLYNVIFDDIKNGKLFI